MPFFFIMNLKAIRSLLNSLGGASEYDSIDEEDCPLRPFDGTISSLRDLPAGLPYSAIAVSSFMTLLFGFIDADSTGFMTTYIMDTPGALSTLVRLLLHSVYPDHVVRHIMYSMMLMLVSPSPRRAELVNTLRHWRFGQALFKFGLLDPESPFEPMVSALYGIFDAADLFTSYEPLPLAMIDPLENEVWWVTITDPSTIGHDNSTTRIGLHLKWVPGEDGVVNIEGFVMPEPPTGRNIVTGTLNGSDLELVVQTSPRDKLIFSADYLATGNEARFFCGVVSSELSENEGAVGSCLIWRDPCSSSPEFWSNPSHIPLSVGDPSWFTSPSSEGLLNDLNLTRMLQYFIYAGSHYMRTVQVETARRDIPQFENLVADPKLLQSLSSSLIQHRFESDAAINSRCFLFLGASIQLMGARKRIFQDLEAQNLVTAKRDRDLICFALRSAYASIEEDVLIAAGIVNPLGDPNVSSKLQLLASLGPSSAMNESHIIQAILAQKEELFGTSKFLEASAKVLDAAIRAGIEHPSNTVADFGDLESHINGIYRKYSSTVTYLHPALCTHEVPFSFEQIFSFLSTGISLAERNQIELECGAHKTKYMNYSMFGSLGRFKRTREGNGISTSSLLLLGAGALSALAIGTAAFLIGRHSNKS